VKRMTLAVAIAVCVLASSCSATGIAFRQDKRLTFVQPDDREKVSLPITIEWEVRDFAVGRGAGSFAVFVDRSPQPPRKTLEWLARNDDACQVADDCPDESWFAERGVYRTTDTEFTIEQLPVLVEGRRDMHEITVVLLDERGRRVAETAFTRRFEVERSQ